MSSDSNTGIGGTDRRSLMKGLGVLGLAATLGGPASGNSEAVVMPDRHGPLRNTRFQVEFGSLSVTGFSRVELPEATTETVEYREGNDPSFHRNLKGNDTFDSLILERGVVVGDTELYDWFQKIQDGQVDEARDNIAVVILNAQGEPAARWEFVNAWPTNYDGPSLDAMGEGDIATETLTVAYDEMERTE